MANNGPFAGARSATERHTCSSERARCHRRGRTFDGLADYANVGLCGQYFIDETINFAKVLKHVRMDLVVLISREREDASSSVFFLASFSGVASVTTTMQLSSGQRQCDEEDPMVCSFFTSELHDRFPLATHAQPVRRSLNKAGRCNHHRSMRGAVDSERRREYLGYGVLLDFS